MNKSITFILLLILLINKVNAQVIAPPIEWQLRLGGSSTDMSYSVQVTDDNGYILVGYTNSADGNVTDAKGGDDVWIVKLDQNGRIEWQKIYGGSGNERAHSIIQTQDKGYIITGYTDSTDGDLSGNVNKGGFDGWFLKINELGNIEWSRTYGGSNHDQSYQIKQTLDGDYVFCGFSDSSDGDIPENKGGIDIMIGKLGNLGELKWIKTFGGSQGDEAYSISVADDNGCVVAASTSSSDGDVTESKGQTDGWVLKLSIAGDIEWQKFYGGSGSDIIFSINPSSDGGFIMAGSSNSSNGDLAGNNGDYDGWVIKLDNVGNVSWSKNFGGAEFDRFQEIIQNDKGEFIAVGTSSSNSGDVKNNQGGRDGWIVKLDNLGNLVWKKSLGGEGADVINSIHLAPDGAVIASGNSDSSNESSTLNGEITKKKGGNDYWVIKLFSNEITPGGVITVGVTRLLEDDKLREDWMNKYGSYLSNYPYSRGTFLWTDDNGDVKFVSQIAPAPGFAETRLTGPVENCQDGDESGPQLPQGERIFSSGGILRYIMPTDDGGYIAVGDNRLNQVNDCGEFSISERIHYWIIKFNSDLTIQWQKHYGGEMGINTSAYKIIKDVNGDYIICGSVDQPIYIYEGDDYSGDIGREITGPSAWIVKLDQNGNLKNSWAYDFADIFGEDSYNKVIAYDIIESNDGGHYVFVGSVNSDVYSNKYQDRLQDNYLIAKINAKNGQMVWYSIYGGNQNDVAYSILPSSNKKGYIISGLSESNEGSDLYITDGVKSNYGGYSYSSSDFWVLYINEDGNFDEYLNSQP